MPPIHKTKSKNLNTIFDFKQICKETRFRLSYTWELLTSVLNMERLFSWNISLYTKQRIQQKLTRRIPFLRPQKKKQNQTKPQKWKHKLTFCISLLDTYEPETFSMLSFNTSIIASVIACACFDSTPCASSFLTYINIITAQNSKMKLKTITNLKSSQ